MRKFDDGLEDMFPGINFEMWRHEMTRSEPIRIYDKYDHCVPNFRIDVMRRNNAIILPGYVDASTEVIEEVLRKAAEEAFPTSKPEEKERVDDIERRARKPPKDGPCRRCGKDKPLNRLFLCYPCWVSKMNKERGWRDGQPHPDSCGCDLECRFDSKDAGN